MSLPCNFKMDKDKHHISPFLKNAWDNHSTQINSNYCWLAHANLQQPSLGFSSSLWHHCLRCIFPCELLFPHFLSFRSMFPRGKPGLSMVRFPSFAPESWLTTEKFEDLSRLLVRSTLPTMRQQCTSLVALKLLELQQLLERASRSIDWFWKNLTKLKDMQEQHCQFSWCPKLSEFTIAKQLIGFGPGPFTFQALLEVMLAAALTTLDHLPPPVLAVLSLHLWLTNQVCHLTPLGESHCTWNLFCKENADGAIVLRI